MGSVFVGAIVGAVVTVAVIFMLMALARVWK